MPSSARPLPTLTCAVVLAASLSSFACEGAQVGSDGGLDGDVDAAPTFEGCDDDATAIATPACALALGVAASDALGAAGDVDVWTLALPSVTAANELVRVRVDRADPSDLAVGVEVAIEGAAPSSRVLPAGAGLAETEVYVRRPTSAARLFVRVTEEGAGTSRPPIRVVVDTRVDPDAREVDDVAPTEVALASAGCCGTSTGTASGVLAFDGDVDRFTVTPAADAKVVAVRLAGPGSTTLDVRPLVRLVAPGDVTCASATQASTGAFELHAFCNASALPFTVVVEAVEGVGHESATYEVEVSTYEELDANEPNDDFVAAKVIAGPAVDAPASTETGALTGVGDVDVYAVDLAVQGAPTVFAVDVRATGASPRFPAGASGGDRRVRVYRTAPNTPSCLSDPAVCPRGPDATPALTAEIDAGCADPVLPRCLVSQRVEDPAISPLEGGRAFVPIPPHASAIRLYVVVDDVDGSGGQDEPYTLSYEVKSDPDEASRYSGAVEVPVGLTLAYDATGATFPDPPAGATVLSGTLSHGYGSSSGELPLAMRVRGDGHYDAVPSDVDTYDLALPAALPEPLDLGWALSWSVETEAGEPVHDLQIDLELCDGSAGPCTKVDTTSGGEPLRFVYEPAPIAPWHAPSVPMTLTTRTTTEAEVETRVTAEACACIEPRFVRGGTVRLRISARDRQRYADVGYTVRTAAVPYPTTYDPGTGATSCPPPVSDGEGGFEPGCRFVP